MNLPHYTLTQKVFEGSETIVYRGRRDADGAAVAVKATRNEYPTARELARLRREFGILQELEGLPSVVRAYALEKCGRGLSLVMEDLGTRSLQSALSERRLDVATALSIAITLADALEASHRRGVIHKDIKPLNIMLDEATLAPHIVDFGIAARLSQEIQQATPPSFLEGTLAYISPEQTGRMNRAVDRRADLYSLGATLYEMLTGTVPFAVKDPKELIHSHIARTPAPPHERDVAVPRALSDVVMRLLAKTPEERYQTARGLKADLEECLRQWSAVGTVKPFPLGRCDASGELRVPQKLYGREAQVDALLAAFERAQKGRIELVTVSGDGGVGKSALVNEIHKPIARKGGYFVRGKFDQVSRDVPLLPLARALRDLLRQILAEPPRALEAWKARLLEAVGANGRLLFDLIPELEIVIGPQPEAPSLGPSEASNRFGLLVERFVRAFAAPEHLLCIFLDDLQWADPASLRLLGVILGDPESKHLLVVGAYRDGEVDAAHLLPSTLEEAQRAGVTITALKLAPLDRPTVTQIVAEALSARAVEVEDLAALVFDKTRGNPFFLGQFLGALHEERLIGFDAAAAKFTWDLPRIRAAKVTDNVVELMVGKLKKLPPGAQRALSLAACVGHAFELTALSAIDERASRDVAADLWEALREGLVVPVGGDYRLLEVSAGAEPSAGEADLKVVYRFLHDRVREAAYALIEDERKAEVHLSIGRLLLGRGGAAPPDEDLLEIVRHLNLGARCIETEAERVAVAALDLRAGRRARASTAYQAAASYFAEGLARIGEAGWESAYDLCFALHVEGAESAHLSGAPERAEALFEAALPRAKTRLERARVQNLRVVLYVAVGKFSDAVRVGIDGLTALGVRLPETPEEEKAAFEAGLAEAARSLGDRRVEDLLDAPQMDDPVQRAALQLLCDLSIPVYAVAPSLYGATVLMQVNASLKHGHADVSAFAYMIYGFMLAAMLGKPEQGHAFGALALALNERLRNASLRCKLEYVFTGYVYLREPLSAVLALCQRARKSALAAGDFVYLSSAWYSGTAVQLALGVQLDEVRDAVSKGLAVVQRIKSAAGVDVLTVLRQTVANLQGRTRDRLTLSGDGFEEDDLRGKLGGKDQSTVAVYFYLCKLQILYLHGDYAGALSAADEARLVVSSIFGSYFATRLDFYTALALLALPPAGSPEEAARRREAIARRRAPIERLAAIAPGNFQHQLLLLDAEAGRVDGRTEAAGVLYDQAVALAKEGGFAHDEALANELCGKLYLSVGKPKFARSYIIDAHLGYLHWGATAKAEDIERAYGHLLPAGSAAGQWRTKTGVTSTTSGTTWLSGVALDSVREAALVVRATQAIAGEIMLPRVIERLSKIVLENAGAQRGALLLVRGGRLLVEATFGASHAELDVGPSAPLETRDDIAQSVPLFVARTLEPVVLDDARGDARFAADPRVAAGHARAILCLPLLHQGRLSGLLYLEHADATAAFNEARVELLGLFAAQAAIAIENAQLLAEVRAANEEVQRANARLEAEVAQRTEELSRANRELTTANQRLEVELFERAQVERERALLQEQMIEAQRARLSELSTPLIPITSRVVVMPLIGTVDADRAAQVLEAALRGAQQHRARVVILDITGMKHVDGQAVTTLLRAASALRLLGAQAVLTGVRPEVAQAMVSLGQRLDEIVTLGTLESGIAYALKNVGENVGDTANRRRSRILL